MAKTVNITDKLDFDGNPIIVIKDKEIEVDASAETVLKVMGKFSEGNTSSPKAIVEMYELIFPEESREKIKELKLSFKDFSTVVEAGIDAIVGNDEEQGE